MSNFRRQTAEAMAQAIQDRVSLQEPPTVIAAPPSLVTEYPRCAIWLEDWGMTFAQEDEPDVDANGQPLLGAMRRLDRSNVAGPAMIDDRTQLTILGTMRGSGRIWVGCRLAPRREEIEDQIVEVFTANRGALGRLEVEIKTPKVGKRELPWKWSGHAFLQGSSWSNELAFFERLWTWIRFDVDITMLAGRLDPLVRRFHLEADVDHYQPTDADGFVTDLDGGADDTVVEIT